MNTRKLLASFLCLFFSFSTLCQTAWAQGANSSNLARDGRSAAEDVRVERLVGLAKVWGVVKYFHPVLAYREIDWDKALLDAIPLVNAAKNPRDYQTALNHMLSVLNDKSTRSEEHTSELQSPCNLVC